MTDPNYYRFYDCNIKCPKISATEIRGRVIDESGTSTSYSRTVSNQTDIVLTQSTCPALNKPLNFGLLTLTGITHTTGYYFTYTFFVKVTSTDITVTQIRNSLHANISGSLTMTATVNNANRYITLTSNIAVDATWTLSLNETGI